MVLLTAGAIMVLLPEGSWVALKLCPNSWACKTRKSPALLEKSCRQLYLVELQMAESQAMPMVDPVKSRLVHREATSCACEKPLGPQLVKLLSKVLGLLELVQGSLPGGSTLKCSTMVNCNSSLNSSS